MELIRTKDLGRGYVVTKSLNDLGPLEQGNTVAARIMRIPAPLLCYWIGLGELGEFASESL